MITHNNNIQQKFCRSGKIYRLRAIDKTLTPDKDPVLSTKYLFTIELLNIYNIFINRMKTKLEEHI